MSDRIQQLRTEEITRLRRPVLRAVSRSFYLSIRFLPAPLRDPVGLAYLLARATDTIADTTEIDPETRTKDLETLSSVIQGEVGPENAEALAKRFSPQQRNESERALIQSLPQCVQWLLSLEEEDRRDIRTVLRHIVRGQSNDVKRFGGQQPATLDTAEELNQYTYDVAGAVGEFWTDIGFRKFSNFAMRPASEMRDLGREYGKGLQVINILRDAEADLATGRCYLPADELAELGVSPDEILKRPEAVTPILDRWRERAEKGIGSGIEYACALRSFRVRFATALPALIGARTLAALRNAGPEALRQRIKIGRDEVRGIVWSTFLRGASPGFLRHRFSGLLGRGD